MKNNVKLAPFFFTARAVPALTVALVAATVAGANARPASAQDVPPASSPASATLKPVPPLRLDHVLARDAAAQISKATGATVLTDSTVSLVPVTFSTVGGALPQVLKQVVGVLPKGVVVRTIMLPAFSPRVALPSGDDVAALYTTQENLVVPVMGAKVERTTNTINVLGKLLPEDKAAPIIAALDLQPVYLLTNASAGDNLVAQSAKLQAEGTRLWQGMTPEQRTQAAEQQFDALMNMDSPTRQAMFSQYAQVGQTIAQKIQSMPQAQRDQFMRDVTGGMRPPTPPSGGGSGKQ